MRAIRAARASLVGLMLLGSTGTAVAKDRWLGCWTRIYDAEHLAKHQAQDVTAMAISILALKPAAPTKAKYAAQVEMRVRGKPELHRNVGSVSCRPDGARLHYVAKDASQANFWLKRSGTSLQLQLTAAGEGVETVSATNPTGFVQILPQNPEHELFVLELAAAGACAI
jgi:hypothetical protein